MMSLRWLSRIAWNLPVALMGFALAGVTSVGCQGGEVMTGPDDGGVADAGAVCTPASCAGLAAPALAKVCPDGTTVSATVCEDQGGGQCGWGFPACRSDTCAGASALPCVPCPFGSVGVGKDQNGCDTCPICAPAPDGSASRDACPPPSVCNLPNCPNGVVPRTDSNGCAVCPICAPTSDAADCDCGPPPPVPACPGEGGSRTVTCEPMPGGSCSWSVSACPPSEDGGAKCVGDSDCQTGQICGFLLAGGCGVDGKCFPAPQAICAAFSPGCACDGSEVNVACNGLPGGYVTKPLSHTGACGEGD